jgi:hypothetical protein
VKREIRANRRGSEVSVRVVLTIAGSDMIYDKYSKAGTDKPTFSRTI